MHSQSSVVLENDIEKNAVKKLLLQQNININKVFNSLLWRKDCCLLNYFFLISTSMVCSARGIIEKILAPILWNDLIKVLTVHCNSNKVFNYGENSSVSPSKQEHITTSRGGDYIDCIYVVTNVTSDSLLEKGLLLSSPVPNPKSPMPSPNPVKSSQNQFQRDWDWH